MKKFLLFMMEVIIAFSLCSCKYEIEIREPNTPLSKNSTNEEKDEPENAKEPEKDFILASLVTDEKLPDAHVETVSEDYEIVTVQKGQTLMSEEYQEIYDKYIEPINTAMPLRKDFSKDNVPEGIYGYIVRQCRYLDENVLGIKTDYKERSDIGDSCWVNGRAVEESIARWFPWKPEDYRQYFEYNAETDEYFIPGFGGGPSFSYLTGYDRQGDTLLLFYSFYNDEMDDAQEEYQIYYSGILEVELEEKGWKYVSNEKTFAESGYFWRTDDFSFGVNCEKFLYEKEAIYQIANEDELIRFVVPGGMGHDGIDVDKKLCMISSVNGLWIYDAEKDELRHLDAVPAAEKREYRIDDFWLDGENIVMLCYPHAEIEEGDTEETVEAKSGNIVISVVRFDDFSPVQMIDTGMKTDFLTDPFDKIYPNIGGNLTGAGGIEVFSGGNRKTFDIG